MKRAGRPSTISLRWETWNGVHQTRHRENSGCFTWRTRLSVRDILVCCLNKLYDVPVYISCTVLIKRNVNIKKRPIEILNKLCHLPGGFLLQETELVESEAKFMFFVLSCFIYTLIVEKKNIITKWNMRKDLKLLI